MHYWIIPIGFFIAYFGGGMGMLVYHDARRQGHRKIVGKIRSLAVTLVTAVIYTVLVILLIK